MKMTPHKLCANRFALDDHPSPPPTDVQAVITEHALQFKLFSAEQMTFLCRRFPALFVSTASLARRGATLVWCGISGIALL